MPLPMKPLVSHTVFVILTHLVKEGSVNQDIWMRKYSIFTKVKGHSEFSPASNLNAPKLSLIRYNAHCTDGLIV